MGFHARASAAIRRSPRPISPPSSAPRAARGTRSEDQAVMFPRWAGRGAGDGWPHGGNDYGGCIGARMLTPIPPTPTPPASSAGRTTSTICLPAESPRTDGESVCAESLSQTSPRPSPKSPTACPIRSPSAKCLANNGPDRLPTSYWGPCHTHIDGWAIAEPDMIAEIHRRIADPGRGRAARAGDQALLAAGALRAPARGGPPARAPHRSHHPGQSRHPSPRWADPCASRGDRQSPRSHGLLDAAGGLRCHDPGAGRPGAGTRGSRRGRTGPRT